LELNNAETIFPMGKESSVEVYAQRAEDGFLLKPSSGMERTPE